MQQSLEKNMRTLALSAIAVLALATAPALAAPTHHETTHRTVHATSHTSHGTTHTTRHVTTRRTSRTTHGNAGWNHGTSHATSHRTGTGHRTGTNVHVNINIGRLHGNVTSPRRYRFTGNYRRPSGWYAHRWAYGNHLPNGWYGNDYWLSDYVSFGLVAPPDGYQWIREGNDAVLVDANTGEIIRVEYNVFY
jgi:Ni/Co efflux regulator RcnB